MAGLNSGAGNDHHLGALVEQQGSAVLNHNTCWRRPKFGDGFRLGPDLHLRASGRRRLNLPGSHNWVGPRNSTSARRSTSNASTVGLGVLCHFCRDIRRFRARIRQVLARTRPIAGECPILTRTIQFCREFGQSRANLEYCGANSAKFRRTKTNVDATSANFGRHLPIPTRHRSISHESGQFSGNFRQSSVYFAKSGATSTILRQTLANSRSMSVNFRCEFGRCTGSKSPIQSLCSGAD